MALHAHGPPTPHSRGSSWERKTHQSQTFRGWAGGGGIRRSQKRDRQRGVSAGERQLHTALPRLPARKRPKMDFEAEGHILRCPFHSRPASCAPLWFQGSDTLPTTPRACSSSLTRGLSAQVSSLLLQVPTGFRQPQPAPCTSLNRNQGHMGGLRAGALNRHACMETP